MELSSVWFALISVLFIGYFFLEGFDYGVGMLMPFLGRDDTDRRVVINTIGPVWDGNEVWLVTAGGAMFAAFPQWYATMFSGFYLALLLMLTGLIGRAVAFEFRSKDRHPAWRAAWDWILCVGSFVPAFLWGVALANLIRGVPINERMQYVGGFWNLLNPYALLGGLVTLSAFLLHGAVFLALKTKGEVQERAHRAAQLLWPPAAVLLVGYWVASVWATDMFANRGLVATLAAVAGALALVAAGLFVYRRSHGWAFVMTGLTIALSAASIMLGLYPRVMVSSLNPDWSLTVLNASSTPYTLRVMTIVALILLPIVLLYQGWTYWIFRKRIGRDDVLEY